MPTAPGFLTNHELDRFLGREEAGQRQRQRLRRAHLLPEPADLGKVRRFNIVLFPRFALAGLIRDLGRIPGATQTMDRVAVKALRAAVRDAARSFSDWSFRLSLTASRSVLRMPCEHVITRSALQSRASRRARYLLLD